MEKEKNKKEELSLEQQLAEKRKKESELFIEEYKQLVEKYGFAVTVSFTITEQGITPQELIKSIR